MTHITLKNGIDSSRLNILLGLFNSWNVEAEVTEDKKKANEKKSALDAFEHTFGMWKDRDIDAKELRRQAWGINRYSKK